MIIICFVYQQFICLFISSLSGHENRTRGVCCSITAPNRVQSYYFFFEYARKRRKKFFRIGNKEEGEEGGEEGKDFILLRLLRSHLSKVFYESRWLSIARRRDCHALHPYLRGGVVREEEDGILGKIGRTENGRKVKWGSV